MIIPPDEHLIVSLHSQEMYCISKGKSYYIKPCGGDTYYFELRKVTDDRILDAKVTTLEQLCQDYSLDRIVTWMAKGYKGLPMELEL